MGVWGRGGVAGPGAYIQCIYIYIIKYYVSV